MEFFSKLSIDLVITIALSCINGVLLCFLSGKLLHVLQLGGYKVKELNAYLKETKFKYVGRLIMLCFLSVASMTVTIALLDGHGKYWSYIGLVFYFYFSIVFITNVYQTPQKTPLKQTRRMNRLTVCVFIVSTALTFALISIFSEWIEDIKFAIISITPLFVMLIVPLCHFICVPIEFLFRTYYLGKAKKKLSKMPNLIKIGITGSYGKTTTKHILNVMLSKKYSVCMSPYSFNTPMGLTKVINNYLKDTHEVLICEMGARQVGDIAYLCKLIKPKHAIITSVCDQHLATFGSVENVYKAKKELVDSISGGIISFNAQSEGAKKMYDECQKNKILCGIGNKEYFANISNVKVSSIGSTFDLTIKGKTLACQTKLLGLGNLEDIAVASGIAFSLGVKLSEIKSAIASLKPMPHRLEILQENGLTVIDNSFNASRESSREALNVLSMFPGEKIVVTPGLVELGDSEFDANVMLGKQISKVASKVIIVNETNKVALTSGLKDQNFDEKNIFTVENLDLAKDKLKEFAKQGDVILFENDLPDNYI